MTVRYRQAGAGTAARDTFDAVVLEEDSYGVLSADPRVRPPASHPIRIMTGMHDQQPLTPGSVRVREGRPLKLLAVVHDLDQDPSCREEWITEALGRVVALCRERRLRHLLLEPLGEVHGSRSGRPFRDLLEHVLANAADGFPETVTVAPGRLASG